MSNILSGKATLDNTHMGVDRPYLKFIRVGLSMPRVLHRVIDAYVDDIVA